MRKWLYALITIFLSTGFALIIGELFLVVYSSGTAVTDEMEPGLIRYHPRYGWSLTPGWQGSHTHSDYAVRYSVDAFGLRDEPLESATPPPNAIVSAVAQSKYRDRKTLIVGDSFTFGLGVENDETFTALLNQGQPSHHFINGAVPGYSPEQVLLRAIDLSRRLKPDQIVFVVYLGNDLIDLGLEFPVQAEFPKPIARIGASGWELSGMPVPKKQKSALARQQTLASFVVEPGSGSWLSHTQTGRRLIAQGLMRDPAKLNESKVQASLTLFAGILDEFNKIPMTQQVVLLLPGAIAVKEPDSITGRYQRHLEAQILQMTAERGIKSIALLPVFLPGSDGADDWNVAALYFPNDGHLTPLGHGVVARELAQQFNR